MCALILPPGTDHTNTTQQTDRKGDVTTNSVYLSSLAAGIICLINLVSKFAFEVIISLTLLALLSTYMLSIGCVLRKRILKEPLPHARWSLGRWGLFINGFAFVYCAFAIVFCCFPPSLPVDTSNANWAPAAWVGVILISWVVYIVHGKNNYTPPVVFVEGNRVEDLKLQGTK